MKLFEYIDKSLTVLVGWNVGVVNNVYEVLDSIIVADAANLVLALKETLENDVILSIKVSNWISYQESVVDAAAQVLGPRSALKIQSGFNTIESYGSH